MGTVDDYLAGLPAEDRDAVAGIYAIARDLVPDAEQGKGYGMPALTYRGKPLLSVMATKKHIGIYPFSSAAVEAAADELPDCDLEKGTVRLQRGVAVPVGGITTLVTARKAQIEG